MPTLEAVLFDLGDTLIQYGAIDKRAMFREGAKRTYRFWAAHQQRMPDFRRYYLHQWFAIHWGQFKVKLCGREVDAMRLLRRACEKLWLNAPEPFYRELAWQWYQPLAEVAAVEPGTHQMLDCLSRAGCRLGIISNTFVPGFVIDRHLQQVGLLHYFPHRIYSCDVGYRKPDRRIFTKALEVVGCDADKTAFVGDMLAADVYGAHRAGLRPIWKRTATTAQADTAPPAPPTFAESIEKLTELPEKLGVGCASACPRAAG